MASHGGAGYMKLTLCLTILKRIPAGMLLRKLGVASANPNPFKVSLLIFWTLAFEVSQLLTIFHISVSRFSE